MTQTARDAAALLKVIEITAAAALATNPPYGHDHHRIAEAFLSLLRGGSIRLAALLVPHQFDAAGRRGHLFQDPLCALRIVMPWRPAWIAGTKGGGDAPPRTSHPHRDQRVAPGGRKTVDDLTLDQYARRRPRSRPSAGS